jgi:DNA-binding PadR family transcriptional regulator
MSLRHGILGLLAGKPMSGYDLTQEFDQTLSHVWSASHSQIYPELSRLVEDGLIEHVDSGPRGRKLYGATDAGRAEVLRWLREDDPGRVLRVEAMLQGFFLWMLEPDEAISLLDREREYHAARLSVYETRALDGTDWEVDAKQRTRRIMLDAGIRYEQGLVEWSTWAIGELQRAEQLRGARFAP